MDRPPTRRRGRLIRFVALAVGGVIVLAAAGLGIAVATFDPDSRKPEIIAAVQQATGRQLTIGGRIGLSLLPQPTLRVSDVTLSNPPGFSRPNMATLQGLEVRIALLPLLSKEIRIDRLVLRDPDILLETNAKGQSNWDLAPAASLAAAATGASPRAGLPAAASGGSAGAVAPGAGSAGAVAPEAGSPGAAPAAPSSAASPTGRTAPEAPPRIALSSLKIEGGKLAMRDAGGRTTTLALTQLTAEQTTPSAPLHVTMDAGDNGVPVTLTADTGPLGGLIEDAGLGGGTSPWPVKLVVTAAGAKLSVDGSMAQPAAGHGMAVTVSADIPDLAALSGLAGTALPPLKTIAARLKLADTDGGNGIAAGDLALTTPDADLTGSLSVRRGARPAIDANLSSRHIDLDAISRAVSPGTEARTQAAKAADSGSADLGAADWGQRTRGQRTRGQRRHPGRRGQGRDPGPRTAARNPTE